MKTQSFASPNRQALPPRDGVYITEIFCSIQGETSLSGLPTAFIRLAGCNLRCNWCDTPYSFEKGKLKEIEEILEEIAAFGVLHVCVTGGEPLIQKPVLFLLKALCDAGYIVNLETGGSITIDPVDPRVITILDIKCPKSGMSHKNFWPNLSLLREQDEVKFVVLDEEDYRFAKEVCEAHRLFERTKPVLFSPVHDLLDPKQLIAWILKDRLFCRLNLQIHKWVWSPTCRGV